jgi:peptidoglycan/LPS O-acetylase OafA/YrhL
MMVDTLTAIEDAPLRPAEAVPAGRARIADIELLRGIAVLFVMLHHTHGDLIAWPSRFLDWLFSYSAYWAGVDVFFAISGFVIARSLLPALDACAGEKEYVQTVLAFWIRRAWRLLPSAWLWLAVALLASAAFNQSGAFDPFRANVATTAAALANVENFHLAATFGAGPSGTSFVYWSLSLEEQFYLVLPIAAFLLRRRLPWLAAALVALQIFQPRGLVTMVTRTDAILLGVLVAGWSKHPTWRLFEPTGLASSRIAGPALLAVALFALATLGSDPLGIVSLHVGVIAVISAGLVLVASYDRDYLWPPGMTKRVLMWIGSRSYGLYLIHVPVYFLTREIWYRLLPEGGALGPADTLRVTLTALPLLLALGEANYRLVEAPMRRRGAAIAARFGSRPAVERR